MPSLYTLKCLCAFCVIVIHTSLLGSRHLAPMLTVAVPCFFMCSGYFLYASGGGEWQRIKKWVRKVLLVLAATGFFYLCFLETMTWLNVWLFFFEGSVNAIHLWYLSAMWQGLIVMGILIKLNRTLLFLSPVAWLIVEWLYWFEVDASMVWLNVIRCVLIAVSFMSFGYALAWFKYKTLAPMWIDVLTFVFVYAVMRLVVNEPELHMWREALRVPLGVSLFAIALKWEKPRCQIAEWIGKYHSANIYYIHIFVEMQLHYLLAESQWKQASVEVMAVLVFFGSLLYSILINAVIKWGQQLYLRWRCSGVSS